MTFHQSPPFSEILPTTLYHGVTHINLYICKPTIIQTYLTVHPLTHAITHSTLPGLTPDIPDTDPTSERGTYHYTPTTTLTTHSPTQYALVVPGAEYWYNRIGGVNNAKTPIIWMGPFISP
jgi:hypothetical protein